MASMEKVRQWKVEKEDDDRNKSSSSIFHLATKLSQSSLMVESDEKRRKPIWVRIIWILVVLAGIIATVCGLVDVVGMYLKKPMSTEYRIVSKALDLPTIEICAPLHLSKTKLKNMNVSENLTEAIFYGMGFQSLEGSLTAETEAEYHELLLRNGLADFEDLLGKLTFSCHEFITACYFGGAELDCCSNTTVELVLPDRCIQIETKGKDSFVVWGLTVVLQFLEEDEEFIFASNTFNTRDIYFGIPGKNFGLLRPQFWYMTALKKTEFESVNNPPDFVCRETLSDSYNADTCIWDCSLSLGEHKCSCEPVVGIRTRRLPAELNRIESNKTLPICNPWELRNCTEMGRTNIHIASKDRLQECQDKCPQPCTQSSYDFKVVATHLDEQSWTTNYAYSNGITNLSLAKTNLSRQAFLDVRYEKQEYTKIKQYFSMTVGTVLSNFGGQLGLFLGCSILTGVHFLLYLFQTFVRTKELEEQERRRSYRRSLRNINGTAV